MFRIQRRIPVKAYRKRCSSFMENIVKESLITDNRSVCVGKNTEKLVKLMGVTTNLYGEIYKAIEDVYGVHLVDDIFKERFVDAFNDMYEGLKWSIGESVWESVSFKDNHTKTQIVI